MSVVEIKTVIVFKNTLRLHVDLICMMDENQLRRISLSKNNGLLKMLKLNDSIRWDKRIFALCTHSDRFITQCTNTKVRATEEMQKDIMIGFVNNLCIFSSSWLLGLIVTKTMKTLNSKTIFFVIPTSYYCEYNSNNRIGTILN